MDRPIAKANILPGLQGHAAMNFGSVVNSFTPKILAANKLYRENGSMLARLIRPRRRNSPYTSTACERSLLLRAAVYACHHAGVRLLQRVGQPDGEYSVTVVAKLHRHPGSQSQEKSRIRSVPPA
jgi:hypothetical protein